MLSTRLLARSGAALAVVATIVVGTSSAAYAEKPAAKTNQGSTNHSCDGSHHSDTGHGANTDGPSNPYHNTCDEDVASANGKGDGAAKGRPAAGTVGNADDKNPRGQAPGPQDRNNGYECDGNQGIAKGNPAHTGCTAAPAPAPAPTTVAKPAAVAVAAPVAAPVAPVTSKPAGRPASAEVLSQNLSKPVVSAPLTEAAVGGVQLDRRPLVVGGVSLPLTGGQASSLFAFGGMLVAGGVLILTMGRRTAQ